VLPYYVAVADIVVVVVMMMMKQFDVDHSGSRSNMVAEKVQQSIEEQEAEQERERKASYCSLSPLMNLNVQQSMI
jgi:hypothetical protein